MYKASQKTVYALRTVFTAYTLPTAAIWGGAAAVYLRAGVILMMITVSVWLTVCLWCIPSYCVRYCICIENEHLIIQSGVLTRKTVRLKISEIQYCETASLLPQGLFDASFVRIYTCGGRITTCPFDTATANELIKELDI